MDSDDSAISLQKQAINAALSFNWEQAVLINKQIIKQAPEDVDCLNRLARALFELGKYPQAKKIYQSVLKMDPYNSIAQKNLKKVSSFKASDAVVTPSKKDDSLGKVAGSNMMVSAALFLEEPGVTTVVNLIKLAEPQKLGKLSPGMLVNLVLKNRRICVTDPYDTYLGVLPDDISHLILKLLNGGNKYQALIKSVKSNSLSILIRETFRSRKFRNQPSFLADAKTVSYSSDHISLHNDDMDESPTDTSESEESLV